MSLWVSSQCAFRCWLIARFVAIRTISFTLLVGPLLAQQAEPADIPGQQTGMSTGVAHAPVKDALSRPITAGGFLDNAPVIFSDITHAAGLDKFHHKAGTPEKTTILETPGSGVALLDYDNDGWLDIYLLNGSTFPALKGKEAPPRAQPGAITTAMAFLISLFPATRNSIPTIRHSPAKAACRPDSVSFARSR